MRQHRTRNLEDVPRDSWFALPRPRNGEKNSYYNEIPGSPLARRPGMTGSDLRAGPLVPHALQFHRAVGDRDAESGADGAFDEVDVAAMGADQLVGDGKAKSTAAEAAG